MDSNLKKTFKVIAEKWVELGRTTEDDVFRFVAYWLAFVQLYNGLGDIGGEKNRIRKYCDDEYPILVQLMENIDSNDLEKLGWQPIVKGRETVSRIDRRQYPEKALKSYVSEKLEGQERNINSQSDVIVSTRNYIALDKTKPVSEEKVEAVFCAIYMVRCNLFHGEKDLGNKRDIGLIRASANILENCVPALIEHTFGEE